MKNLTFTLLLLVLFATPITSSVHATVFKDSSMSMSAQEQDEPEEPEEPNEPEEPEEPTPSDDDEDPEIIR